MIPNIILVCFAIMIIDKAIRDITKTVDIVVELINKLKK